MPIKKIWNYQWVGPAEVELYTEDEMAEAMSVTTEELLSLLSQGGHYLTCHAHPLSNKERKYYFTQPSFENNISVWSCPGHEFVVEKEYLGLKHSRCKYCPADKYDHTR